MRIANDCRYGSFFYPAEDRFMGASLRTYGEWSQEEVELYAELIKIDDFVVEVGANVGALTVPLSKMCQRVMALEPQPEIFKMLQSNIVENGCFNVFALHAAGGAKTGRTRIPSLAELDEANEDYVGAEVGTGSHNVDVFTLDSITAVANFIKLDCEGSELETLIGAEKLVLHNKPILYVENNRPEKSDALIGWLVNHGYILHWHRPQLFRENNWRRYHHNIFGDCSSPNMICMPKGRELHPRWAQEPVK